MSRPGVKRTARKKPKPKSAVALGKAAPEAVAIVTRKTPAPAKGSAAPRTFGAAAKASAAPGKGGAARGGAGRPRAASRALSPRALRALGILLLVGGVLAFGLLVRELFDAVADRGRGHVFTEDLSSAAASVAMLVFLAIVWRVARARRD